MRLITTVLLCVTAAAQVPERDSRLANTPGTNTHFAMPVYKTLAEWEERRAHLRKQILSAPD